MPYCEISAGRMFYKEAGDSASDSPIIFLHGFSLDHRMWQPQVEFFSRAEPPSGSAEDVETTKGFRPTRLAEESEPFARLRTVPQGFRPTKSAYRVITPDAIGHGRSDVPLTGYSRAHRVQDLAEFVDKLEIGKFHLVGLSMGGATAIGYALEHQERLESLTLVSTGAAGYSVSKKFDRLDQVARKTSVESAKAEWIRWCRAYYQGELVELGRWLEEIMNDYSGAVWGDPMRGKYPKEDDLSRVGQMAVPTAIFAGALDKVFSRLATKLNERIDGSQLAIYENTGHMLNLEQSERFNTDLEVFLEGATQS